MGQTLPAVRELTDLIGQVINYRYEVLEKCGDGSFFSVFKARDKVLNRLVAVKVLSPQYSQHTRFAERLIEEAQMVEELNHPNIGRVFEADSDEGMHFTTVEYVRGMNLKDRIRRTAPFAVAYGVDIGLAVAQALDYAHRSGVTHGDVRPHNILTSPEGQVKLTDFGTAKAVAAFPEVREATMFRTVHYMSPEVIRGEPAGPSSDIYSLGVVLYEMLTGMVPYDGATSAAVAARVLQDPVPSPKALNSAIPQILNDVVMKAMRKDQTQRFATAAEFVNALTKVKEWLRTGETQSWPPAKTSIITAEETVYEPEARPENLLRTAIITLLAVLGIAVVTSVLVVMLTGGPQKAELSVPDLVGKTWEQAVEIADRTGLQLEEYRREFNEQYPEGQVYMSNPKPGGMVSKEHPVIQVWISKGPKTLIVPMVVGMTDSEARRKIADAGFVPGRTVSEYSDATPAGEVVRQSPLAGQRLEPLKTVDITVSLGPEITPGEASDSDPDTGPTDTGDTTSEPVEPRMREFTIDVSIPASTRRSQEVRIVVDDANGRSTAYQDTHQPGEEVNRSVTGYGEDVQIKVYIGTKLVRDVVYSGDDLVRDRAY